MVDPASHASVTWFGVKRSLSQASQGGGRNRPSSLRHLDMEWINLHPRDIIACIACIRVGGLFTRATVAWAFSLMVLHRRPVNDVNIDRPGLVFTPPEGGLTETQYTYKKPDTSSVTAPWTLPRKEFMLPSTYVYPQAMLQVWMLKPSDREAAHSLTVSAIPAQESSRTTSSSSSCP